MKIKKKFYLPVIQVALSSFLLLGHFEGSSQCTSGYSSGNLTISSACTISSDITITGNLILTNSASLVIDPGVTVTVSGDLQTGYMAGALNISGGGSLGVSGRFFNDVRTNTSFTFSNVDVTVGNNGGVSTSINNYGSTMSLLNGSSFTVTNGTFENDNGAGLTIDNSTLTVSSGDFINDFQAVTTIQNNGSLIVSNGNLITEDQSHLTVDNSTVMVSGNMNNDYYAQLDVQNNSTFTIGGDFNNGSNTDFSVTSGYVNVNGSNMSVGGNFDNDYGSDVTIDGGGTLSVTNDLTNDQAATIDIPDGSLVVGGTITDNFGGINASCSGGCCGNGCGALPVTVIVLEYHLINNHVVLEWKTASELNNDYFTIEKSTDGKSFIGVGQIAGNGTTDVSNAYVWKDKAQLVEKVYYRLKQTDFNGSYTYERVIVVDANNDKSPELEVMPNPVSQDDLIYIHGAIENEAWQIKNTNGQVLREGILSGRPATVDISGLNSGIYILDLHSNRHQKQVKIIVK
ncbi:T9SS type A sorting domain-containing protein [Fulvivirga sp. 29W222]|uniref:T9SS type A sorting domain-containing protein n=1 Tax=Fulvivirga marina TaxID=2494733 RepID=A0A937KCJ0_9BACT|nr:T9SS type A sorting domain-containing protein [Fulvivirga marina]MBL6447439.1 T9SS type A sorting domain-containing protein [Fulvivirga marina]